MLSHYAVHSPLQGKPDKISKYEQIPESDRQGKPAYAAMVESVDDSVGRVIATLRELELEKDTLVIFTSDNGGMWKATSNAPLRANKGANYEGGLRVPVIVKWANRIPAGSVSAEPVISTDFYPTILAATGQPLRPYQHVDGENLMPVLTGQGGLKRDALYWHYPHYNQHPESAPASVIRAGDWKLMQNLETGERELYNLSTDLREQHNLVQRNPTKAEQLQKKLDAWRIDVGADPMKPNPEYVGKQ